MIQWLQKESNCLQYLRYSLSNVYPSIIVELTDMRPQLNDSHHISPLDTHHSHLKCDTVPFQTHIAICHMIMNMNRLYSRNIQRLPIHLHPFLFDFAFHPHSTGAIPIRNPPQFCIGSLPHITMVMHNKTFLQPPFTAISPRQCTLHLLDHHD
jgi:hypothetical protein